MVITELWDKMGQSKEQQKTNFENSAKKLPVGFVATPEDVRTLRRWSLLPKLTLLKIAEAYLYCVSQDFAVRHLIIEINEYVR